MKYPVVSAKTCPGGRRSSAKLWSYGIRLFSSVFGAGLKLFSTHDFRLAKDERNELFTRIRYQAS